jgi:hypothetical protein
MRAALLIAALAAVTTPTIAATPRPAIDVTGNYTSNWGAITLHQTGHHVTGSYVYQQGQLDGTIEGNLLRYAWREGDAKGRGVFVVASDGELIGTWGLGSDDISGGGWRLIPVSGAIASN